MIYCQKQKETKLGKFDSYCNKEENHTSRHWYMAYPWWEKKGLSTNNGRLLKEEHAKNNNSED